MAKTRDDDASLKRLGGGRWQTRDDRFTVEPQSGTWVVVDAEQTDDLGLPLIRGPFGSLGAAKDAIGDARASAKPVKPLPTPTRTASSHEAPASASRAGTAATKEPGAAEGHASTGAPAKAPNAAKPRTPSKASKAETPSEPSWLTDLAPAGRRQARDAIKRLTEAGAPDPEGMTRRDVGGDVPAIAAFAVMRRIDDLGPDARPSAIVKVLADGRDDDLGVRWRIVDGEGRPILLAPGSFGTRRR